MIGFTISQYWMDALQSLFCAWLALEVRWNRNRIRALENPHV